MRCGTLYAWVHLHISFYRVTQEVAYLGLYRTLFYFEAHMHELTILATPTPTCIAHPGVTLMHGYWAVCDSPSELPCVCYSPHNIGNNYIV